MNVWMKLVRHPNGAETWVNFDNVAYFTEYEKDGKFFYTGIVFCAKGDYSLALEVTNRVDEIKTKLAMNEAAVHGEKCTDWDK